MRSSILENTGKRWGAFGRQNRLFNLLSWWVPVLVYDMFIPYSGAWIRGRRREGRSHFSVLDKIPAQVTYLRDLVEVSDDECKDQLRMDRSTFHKLCHLLQFTGGLGSSRNVTVAEKVAMFLSVLAHHTKNRCVKFHFRRSGQTLSKHFHAVLKCVLRLHNLFLVTPQPISDESTDQRWGKFKVLSTFNTVLKIMEQGGSHVSPQVDKLKTTRGRRSWSRVEEDALIYCLMYIVNDGWKAENGFRVGFQRELERGMKRILSMTDIVANPNINSKIHVWKKEYGTLSDLLSKSGIG
ncbi:hypothetical protein ACS0TY_003120 [Phlomoides rotata]